jgi:N-acetylglucosaminyldiphosphoundecaprenol N-acetyl-beta-D-mannosaminyltransferase
VRWHGLGVPIDSVDEAGALAWVEAELTAGRGGWIATPNPEIAVAAWRSPALAEALDTASLVVADGVGLLWASRILGGPLQDRVPGIELLDRILALCAARDWPVYFLGARPGVAAAAATQAQTRWPGLRVVGTWHGYFTASEGAAVLAGIAAARPRFVAVGMGHPRQELWLAANMASLPETLGMACGGSLDVLAGQVGRAPLWVRRASLEWLYRIVTAPRERLGRSGALLVFAGRIAAVKLGLASRLG